MREYVYYPGSFQPLALLTQEAGRKESWHYHCDPNGAPVRLTSLQGEIVWSEKTGVWGEKGAVYADRISNPLRFQGQYFDAETGLHYNRHLYYDPEIAGFISQDPIGLAGGLNVYQYAPNPLGWVDPWGLTSVDATGYSVYGLFESGAKEPYYVGITNDMDRRRGEHLDTERLSPDSRMEPLDRNVTYGQARGYEQYYIEKYKTRTGKIGEAISSTNRGNKYNSFDHGRKDARAKSFKHAYNSKKNGRKC